MTSWPVFCQRGAFHMGKTDMKAEERLNTLLLRRRMRIALAESSTGGLISARITDVAAASDYFE